MDRRHESNVAGATGDLALAPSPRPAIVSVLVPYAVAGPYSYRAPAEPELTPGDIVEVPLGTRDVLGVIWDDPPDLDRTSNRLREVVGKFDTTPLPDATRSFVDWVANYTLATRGMVLRMVLRAPGALEPETPRQGFRLAGPPPERMTKARQKVLDVAADGLAWSKSGLAGAAGVSPGVVRVSSTPARSNRSTAAAARRRCRPIPISPRRR